MAQNSLELLYESRLPVVRQNIVNSILVAEHWENFTEVESLVKILNQQEKDYLIQEGFYNRMEQLFHEAPQFWGGLKNAFNNVKQNYQTGKQQQAQQNLINQINAYMKNGQKLFSQLPTVFPDDTEMQKFVDYINSWTQNLTTRANSYQPQEKPQEKPQQPTTQQPNPLGGGVIPNKTPQRSINRNPFNGPVQQSAASSGRPNPLTQGISQNNPQQQVQAPVQTQRKPATSRTKSKPASTNTNDLVQKGIDLFKKEGKISSSLLQRRLGIDYPTAAKIMDELENKGVIQPRP